MKLSIVIPVYNSSKILHTLLNNIQQCVADDIKNFEVILVNDFSKDDSWERIKELKKRYSYIKGISLKKNYGQHSAIFCGLKNCRGENILCMDDDMQHDPKYILNMLTELNQNDVCYVKYKKRKHNYLKIFVSKLNNYVSSFLMKKTLNIYTSSFKCFRKEISNKIIANDESFIFLDYWIFKFAKKITFIEVTHNERLHGKTNYGFRELLTLWSKMIFLIDVKKNTMRFYLLQIIKGFFKVFLKNYISYKKKDKIEITEII